MHNIANYKANIAKYVRGKDDINIEEICDLSKEYPIAKTVVWNNNHNFTQQNFNSFPNCNLFVNWGTATSNLPANEEFTDRGIQLETVKGYCTKAVSEYTVKLLMDLFNRSSTRSELSGKKIGVIGMGAIGEDTANILNNGFHCDVSYFSRNEKNVPYSFTDLDSLIQESDALVISVDSKTFKIPIELLENAKSGLKIANISQDFILPTTQVIDYVRRNALPNIDIISDNFNKTPGYEENFTPHIAYKSKESIKNKNNLLLRLINQYAK